MRYLPAMLAMLVCCPAVSAQTSRPVPAVNRVLIISIDGLRPDLLLRAKTPNLHRLFQTGAFSFWAQTVPTANTLPSHAAMLTGVGTDKHGLNFNDERATTRPIYPKVPTLFELAKQNGHTTAMVTGKSKFMALAKPGTIDWVSAPDDPKTSDANVADHAGAILRLHKPSVMFVHFPGPDSAGHSKGWGSPEQFAVIEQVDENIGMLLNALRTSALHDSTIVFISSDHGGSGKTHGANDLRSLHIPWIMSGPGVRKNFDLTSIRELTVRTADTFATACYVLGIDVPEGTEGKAIVQGFEQAELLTSVRPATQEVARTTPASQPGSRSE
jgi:predicted AlkP superfamily pyrophosphatase or phosphodiesterase